MKIYPTAFEVLDEMDDVIAVFTAFDEESLEIELKQAIWCDADLRKLADAYAYATEQLIQGKSI